MVETVFYEFFFKQMGKASWTSIRYFWPNKGYSRELVKILDIPIAHQAWNKNIVMHLTWLKSWNFVVDRHVDTAEI